MQVRENGGIKGSFIVAQGVVIELEGVTLLKRRAPCPCLQGLVSEAEVGSENVHFSQAPG